MLVRREAPWDGWHSVPSLDVTEHVCKWFYWILQSIIQSVLIECPLWTRSYLLSVLGIQAVKFKKCLSWFSTETMKTFYSLTYIYLSDVEAETPILWPPDVKSWLIWKDSDAGKDSGQEEKGTTEDELVGWHHRLDGHGFGWTPGVGDGQGGLVCWGSWGHKSDTTEWLNWLTDWKLAFDGTRIENDDLCWEVQGTWSKGKVRDILEKAMAPHSSTLAWKIHGWRSLVGCSPWDR